MSPRPEHTPRPGVAWETRLTSTELIVHDPDDTSLYGYNEPEPPRENRATRRARKRAARRTR